MIYDLMVAYLTDTAAVATVAETAASIDVDGGVAAAAVSSNGGSARSS